MVPMSMRAKDPAAWLIWMPGTYLAGFTQGTTMHCFTQNIEALGLMVSETIFKMFLPNQKIMEANDHRCVANLDHRGMADKMYVGNH